MKKMFMQGSVKKPGALRRQLKVKKGKKIPTKKLTGIASKLHRKASKGKLTQPQRLLDQRVNEALIFRKAK